MSPHHISIASRRRFLQFLAASPLFARQALAEGLMTQDPMQWAPRDLDKLIAEPKDALDVFRLLRAIPIERLTQGLRQLGGNALAGEVTREAISHLQGLFGTTNSAGTVMVVRATERLEDPTVMAASCAALSDDLVRALR